MTLPPEAGKHVAWVDEGIGVVEGEHDGASSLVIDDGDLVLVDAGLPERAARDLAPSTSLLLLTHAHVAHTRHAALFERVWAPKAEARALREPEAFCDVMGVGRPERGLVRQWLVENRFTPVKIEKMVTPGGVLALPRTEWHVVGAPGHSPGLVALYEPRRRILFAPDIGPGAPLYPWPASDIEELESTLKRLGELEVELLLTSHAPPRRRGAKQVFRDLAAAIRQRDAAFYDALEAPRSLVELTDLARIQGEGVRKDSMTRWFERTMVEKHLNRLLARGLAFARQDGRYEQA